MKKFTKYLVFATSIYALLFILKKSEIYFPFISDYLAELICIPIVLGWTKILMDKMNVQNFHWGIWPIIIAIIYFSIVFELIMPNYSSNYTQDFLDIIFYSIGGIIFYYALKNSSTTSLPPAAH